MHQITENELGGKAREVIDAYLALPFGARPSCPYFNNRRKKSRAQLRVLIGKGTPQEIVEEAEISALHMRLDIQNMSADKLKEFLIKEDIGIDCSGFAYHILDALAHERRGKSIKRFAKSNRKGLVGSFLARLRPAENMGVASLANDRNSTLIKPTNSRPGDIIVFLGTGRDGLYNHVMVITAVKDNTISYAHSYSWPTDGLYNHGVREGTITLKNGSLIDGVWTEKGQTGAANSTFQSALNAKEISVRRLNFLM